MNSYDLTSEEYNRILDFKRDLHAHPELSRNEVRTTQKIKEFLANIPSVEILPLPLKTGVLARMKGTGDSTGNMLRGESDARAQTAE